MIWRGGDLDILRPVLVSLYGIDPAQDRFLGRDNDGAFFDSTSLTFQMAVIKAAEERRRKRAEESAEENTLWPRPAWS